MDLNAVNAVNLTQCGEDELSYGLHECFSFSINSIISHYPDLESLAIDLHEIGPNSILHNKRKFLHHETVNPESYM